MAESASLEQALQAIVTGVFSPDQPGRDRTLVDALLHHDRYLVTADFDSYCAKQEEWTRCGGRLGNGGGRVF